MVYYRVVEVAKMLNVSKVTIYDKINKMSKDLKPYIKLKGNVKYIDTQGIELIKQSLKDQQELNNDFTITEQDIEHKYNADIENTHIKHLTQEVEYLRNLLNTKEVQINSQMELIQNFQVLMKKEQEKYLLLEDKVKDLQEAPKGFWNRLFKKSNQE